VAALTNLQPYPTSGAPVAYTPLNAYAPSYAIADTTPAGLTDLQLYPTSGAPVAYTPLNAYASKYAIADTTTSTLENWLTSVLNSFGILNQSTAVIPNLLGGSSSSTFWIVLLLIAVAIMFWMKR
jgi:hypothetical protein